MLTGVDPTPDPALHAQALQCELDWLQATLTLRLQQHFSPQEAPAELPPAPQLPAGSALAGLVQAMSLGREARLVLALALAPHLRPELLDVMYVRNKALDRSFTEFGGWHGTRHGGFLPTGETAAFLIAGNDLARRIALLTLLDAQQPLAAQNVVRLECEAGAEPQLAGALQVSAEVLQRLLTGVWHKPDYNAAFPAKRITTTLEWSDLVLAPQVMDEIRIIQTWLARGPELMHEWGLARSVKPGYRCLFYGPPGTGKTLTASLLGKSAQVDVYRIDLSMVVSKYIGETEKNLARVFDQAQSRRWILFFDEADALFGKRSATQSSNDRYANQEVAYLLQRIEDFPGMIILASNLRGNIDEAFARRFQSMVYFPMPDVNQRLRLWQGMLERPERLDATVDLLDIAERHEISGGAMVNVLRYAALQAAGAGQPSIRAAHLVLGLDRELRKEGRVA